MLSNVLCPNLLCSVLYESSLSAGNFRTYSVRGATLFPFPKKWVRFCRYCFRSRIGWIVSHSRIIKFDCFVIMYV